MKKVFVGFAVAVLVLSGCSRNRERVVATVLGHEITDEAFKERYALFMNTGGKRDNILLRQEILNNMINEILIFNDCTRQGFDRDDAYRRKYEQIESQALVDGLARRISTDTMTVSEQELYDEFRMYNTKVKARYLYAESEGEATKLREALLRGASFDSLAKEIFEDPGLANNGGDLGYFGWNEMEPAFEEAAYTLPIGELSQPIRLKIGYGIMQVLNRVSNPLPSQLDFEKVREKLRRAVVQKKTLKLVTGQGHALARELRPQFDEETVGRVFRHWNVLLENRPAVEMQAAFSDTLKDRVLVTFSNKSRWNVADFLKRAETTSLRQRKRVKQASDVKEFVTGLAVRERLLEKAREAGLAGDREVQQQIQKIRNTYLLTRWMKSVRDTVGAGGWPEDTMRVQYEKFKKEFAFPPEVNVAEILVRTKEEATDIVKQLRRGADFAALAQKHSLRRVTAERGGEIGWGTLSSFGNLGAKFLAANVGALVGPEVVDPYVGVFKILGKHEGRPKTFEEAKPQIAEMLKSAKQMVVTEEAISNLRQHAAFRVNNDVLATIEITPSAQ
jgi:parvulin-like peptidyl-prolyl isomerase